MQVASALDSIFVYSSPEALLASGWKRARKGDLKGYLKTSPIPETPSLQEQHTLLPNEDGGWEHRISRLYPSSGLHRTLTKSYDDLSEAHAGTSGYFEGGELGEGYRGATRMLHEPERPAAPTTPSRGVKTPQVRAPLTEQEAQEKRDREQNRYHREKVENPNAAEQRAQKGVERKRVVRQKEREGVVPVSEEEKERRRELQRQRQREWRQRLQDPDNAEMREKVNEGKRNRRKPAEGRTADADEDQARRERVLDALSPLEMRLRSRGWKPLHEITRDDFSPSAKYSPSEMRDSEADWYKMIHRPGGTEQHTLTDISGWSHSVPGAGKWQHDVHYRSHPQLGPGWHSRNYRGDSDLIDGLDVVDKHGISNGRSRGYSFEESEDPEDY